MTVPALLPALVRVRHSTICISNAVSPLASRAPPANCSHGCYGISTKASVTGGCADWCALLFWLQALDHVGLSVGELTTMLAVEATKLVRADSPRKARAPAAGGRAGGAAAAAAGLMGSMTGLSLQVCWLEKALHGMWYGQHRYCQVFCTEHHGGLSIELAGRMGTKSHSVKVTATSHDVVQEL